jgi:hypothetical protein
VPSEPHPFRGSVKTGYRQLRPACFHVGEVAGAGRRSPAPARSFRNGRFTAPKSFADLAAIDRSDYGGMRGRPSQIGTLKLRLNFSLYGEGSHEDVSKAVHKRVPGSRHEAVGTGSLPGATWRGPVRSTRTCGIAGSASYIVSAFAVVRQLRIRS